MRGMHRRHRFAPLSKPALHEPDLIPLGDVDALGENADVAARPVGRRERDHLQRLRVVGNHPLHEPDVGGGIGRPAAIRPCLRRRRTSRIIGVARLPDGARARIESRGGEERGDRQ
jgi:hypothetical protein